MWVFLWLSPCIIKSNRFNVPVTAHIDYEDNKRPVRFMPYVIDLRVDKLNNITNSKVGYSAQFSVVMSWYLTMDLVDSYLPQGLKQHVFIYRCKLRISKRYLVFKQPGHFKTSLNKVNKFVIVDLDLWAIDSVDFFDLYLLF